MGEDHHRRRQAVGLTDRLVDGLIIVAVDFDDLPAIGLPACADLLRHHLLDGAADLETVIVDKNGGIGKTVLDSEAAGLSDLTFLLLPVAHKAVELDLMALQSGAEAEAKQRAEPLTEIAGAPFDPGHLALDVPFERRVGLTEMGHGVFDPEKAEASERGKDPRGGVTMAGDDPVASGSEGIPGIDVGHCEDSQIEIDGGHTAAGMTTGRQGGHFENIATALAGERLQLLKGRLRKLFLGEGSLYHVIFSWSVFWGKILK